MRIGLWFGLAFVVAGCVRNPAAIKGQWRLEAQLPPSEGVEIPFDDDPEVNLIGWFLSGFEFRSGGVVFGLSTREGRNFTLNRGQRGRYRYDEGTGILLLSDDIFGPTPGRIEEPLVVLRLDETQLEFEDAEGVAYRFGR
ncbi:MAG: hypothetical protein AAGA48_11300 [Myxococcota bacterium]